MMRNVRHYLQAQSQGHHIHTIDHLEVRSIEKGSSRQATMKGRDTATVRQTNIGFGYNINQA